MKRMKLEVSDLRVESFATSVGEGQRGTVFGKESADGTYCGDTISLD